MHGVVDVVILRFCAQLDVCGMHISRYINFLVGCLPSASTFC